VLRFLVACFLAACCFAQVAAYSDAEHLTVSAASANSPQQLLAELSIARRSLETHPCAQANLALGRALSSLGEQESASRFFDRAVELDPRLAEAWFEKGQIISDRGDWGKAADLFRHAIAVSPDYAPAHLALGEMLLRVGQFDNAVSEMNTTLRLDRKSAGAHQGLGLIYLQEGKAEPAVQEFQTAIALRPESLDAKKGLARALAYQHKWSECAALLKKVATANPDSSEAASALGNALMNVGDRDGAEAQFARARELANRELNLLRAQGDRNWGVALRNEGKLPDSAAAFRRALADDPTYCEPHDDLGEILWMQKDSSGALSEFQAAVACSPDSATARNNLGATLLYYKHDIENAMEQFRDAIAVRPGFPLAHLNLGKAFAAKQDFAAAESELRSAIAIDPESASAHVNLGLVLAEKSNGASPEAQTEMQKGLKLDPRLRVMIPHQYLADIDQSH